MEYDAKPERWDFSRMATDIGPHATRISTENKAKMLATMLSDLMTSDRHALTVVSVICPRWLDDEVSEYLELNWEQSWCWALPNYKVWPALVQILQRWMEGE